MMPAPITGPTSRSFQPGSGGSQGAEMSEGAGKGNEQGGERDRSRAGSISTVEITPSVESYLYVPGRACIEGAANPRVRGLLFALLLIAP